MITPEFIHEKIKDPIIVIVRFNQQVDLGIAFCVTLDEADKLQAVKLYSIRSGNGIPKRVAADVIQAIFKPEIQETKQPNVWTMKIDPIEEEIRIIRNKSGKFIAQFPMKAEKRWYTVETVDIDGNKNLLSPSMTIHIHLSYKKDINSPVERSVHKVQAPDDFTLRLRDTLMKK